MNNAKSGENFYFAGKVGIKTGNPQAFDLAYYGKFAPKK
ncbi:hypothetical protein HNP72_001267 [Sphingobacterium soli]|nr:hypothetical protein [Sphingobacterium soli]